MPLPASKQPGNTQPADTAPGARAVWTAKDEALLAELQERRARVHAEATARLQIFTESIAFDLPDRPNGEAVAECLIKHAEALRDALLPFDSRERK